MVPSRADQGPEPCEAMARQLMSRVRDRAMPADRLYLWPQTEAVPSRVLTIPRKTSENSEAVDVVFYAGKSADNATRQSLMGTIYELPGEVHLSKRAAIFEMQRKPDTVPFAGSDLSVGIVPVIAIANRPDRA